LRHSGGVRRFKCNWQDAFTLVELLVMVVVIAALLLLLLSGLPRARQQALERQCVNNLQYVGLSFRQWAIDSIDRYAQQIPNAQGGSLEMATNGTISFTFLVMSNELNTPNSLVCPADDREPASNFSSTLANSNVSYFVGITADETQPQMLLSGDRNLTNGPLTPTRLLLLTTNSAPGWDHQLHRLRGNAGLADGSVQSLDTPLLRRAVTNSGADNLLAFP
jgi:type II secretory pathway pseudopilin PulG